MRRTIRRIDLTNLFVFLERGIFMNYILKQFDDDLLSFSMKNTNDGLVVHIYSLNQNLIDHLPLDLEANDRSLKNG